MQRVRRLASTAVIAALVVSGLSACQAEPDVAAYVGSLGTITEAEVKQVYNEAKDELTASREQVRQDQAAPTASSPAAPLPPVQVPFKQQDVLNALLSVDILGKVAADHHVQPAGEPTIEQVAQGTSYSPSWAYTELYARSYQLRAALLPVVTPAQLTDADLRPVYDRLRAGGAGDSTPYEQFKSQLSEENKKALQQSLGLRDEVAKIVAAEQVKPNPRYGDQQLVLLSAQAGNTQVPLVEVPLSGPGASQAPFVANSR
jgi:hypothetical protein